ncbi:predicted protein [Arabidopsis lyrata subsp. lyrata]|uniref:Predicted protein n=1 Tax=Arabidopsis lyrata subsp. lyrata TaxID=81972 RepID=D7MS16_ARALL|nr:predicted protein [Arabidopsis lyrata subsp. lyrata]
MSVLYVPAIFYTSAAAQKNPRSASFLASGVIGGHRRDRERAPRCSVMRLTLFR